RSRWPPKTPRRRPRSIQRWGRMWITFWPARWPKIQTGGISGGDIFRLISRNFALEGVRGRPGVKIQRRRWGAQGTSRRQRRRPGDGGLSFVSGFDGDELSGGVFQNVGHNVEQTNRAVSFSCNNSCYRTASSGASAAKITAWRCLLLSHRRGRDAGSGGSVRSAVQQGPARGFADCGPISFSFG